MADSQTPYVYVPIDKIVVKPGESITLGVRNCDCEETQIEVRSVGVPGALIGHPQIFFGEGVQTVDDMSKWRSMFAALNSIYGATRLAEPKPPKAE